MSPVVLVVVAVVIVLVIVALVANSRRRHDGVDSFRRQIDALSPEARRNVVDQVQNAAERREREDDRSAPDDGPDGDGSRGA